MNEKKFSDINKENEMIWLEDPTKYDYVRESKYICCSSRFKPIKRRERLKLIGYSKPKKQTTDYPRLYFGVYYWLKPYDRGMPDEKRVYGSPDSGPWNHPAEAVKILRSEE